jgi:hypothetical protein
VAFVNVTINNYISCTFPAPPPQTNLFSHIFSRARQLLFIFFSNKQQKRMQRKSSLLVRCGAAVLSSGRPSAARLRSSRARIATSNFGWRFGHIYHLHTTSLSTASPRGAEVANKSDQDGGEWVDPPHISDAKQQLHTFDDHYQVLGVSPEANSEAIILAYNELGAQLVSAPDFRSSAKLQTQLQRLKHAAEVAHPPPPHS